MGDMADFTNDCALNADDSWGFYKNKGAYSKAVKCKHCGAFNLHWKQHDNGSWWLANTDTGAWHSCWGGKE